MVTYHGEYLATLHSHTQSKEGTERPVDGPMPSRLWPITAALCTILLRGEWEIYPTY